MPVLSQLEFARSALGVRYRASEQPQRLFVDVTVDGVPAQPFAGWAMQCLVDTVNYGGGGGDTFSPDAGRLEIVAGPLTPEAELERSYSWELLVQGVCPRFMRNFVEELRRAGFDRSPTSMTIRGDLALDDTSRSVTEHTVLRWLDDSTTYPAAWNPVPFPIDVITKSDSGVAADLRIVVGAPIDPGLRTDLEFLVLRWLNAVRNHVSEDGEEVFFDPNRMLPVFGQAKTEFRALLPYFVYTSDPARAALVNMLVRLHQSRVPVIEAELGL